MAPEFVSPYNGSRSRRVKRISSRNNSISASRSPAYLRPEPAHLLPAVEEPLPAVRLDEVVLRDQLVLAPAPPQAPAVLEPISIPGPAVDLETKREIMDRLAEHIRFQRAANQAQEEVVVAPPGPLPEVSLPILHRRPMERVIISPIRRSQVIHSRQGSIPGGSLVAGPGPGPSPVSPRIVTGATRRVVRQQPPSPSFQRIEENSPTSSGPVLAQLSPRKLRVAELGNNTDIPLRNSPRAVIRGSRMSGSGGVPGGVPIGTGGFGGGPSGPSGPGSPITLPVDESLPVDHIDLNQSTPRAVVRVDSRTHSQGPSRDHSLSRASHSTPLPSDPSNLPAVVLPEDPVSPQIKPSIIHELNPSPPLRPTHIVEGGNNPPFIVDPQGPEAFPGGFDPRQHSSVINPAPRIVSSNTPSPLSQHSSIRRRVVQKVPSPSSSSNRIGHRMPTPPKSDTIVHQRRAPTSPGSSRRVINRSPSSPGRGRIITKTVVTQTIELPDLPERFSRMIQTETIVQPTPVIINNNENKKPTRSIKTNYKPKRPKKDKTTQIDLESPESNRSEVEEDPRSQQPPERVNRDYDIFKTHIVSVRPVSPHKRTTSDLDCENYSLPYIDGNPPPSPPKPQRPRVRKRNQGTETERQIKKRNQGSETDPRQRRNQGSETDPRRERRDKRTETDPRKRRHQGSETEPQYEKRSKSNGSLRTNDDKSRPETPAMSSHGHQTDPQTTPRSNKEDPYGVKKEVRITKEVTEEWIRRRTPSPKKRQHPRDSNTHNTGEGLSGSQLDPEKFEEKLRARLGGDNAPGSRQYHRTDPKDFQKQDKAGGDVNPYSNSNHKSLYDKTISESKSYLEEILKRTKIDNHSDQQSSHNQISMRQTPPRRKARQLKDSTGKRRKYIAYNAANSRGSSGRKLKLGKLQQTPPRTRLIEEWKKMNGARNYDKDGPDSESQKNVLYSGSQRGIPRRLPNWVGSDMVEKAKRLNLDLDAEIRRMEEQLRKKRAKNLQNQLNLKSEREVYPGKRKGKKTGAKKKGRPKTGARGSGKKTQGSDARPGTYKFEETPDGYKYEESYHDRDPNTGGSRLRTKKTVEVRHKKY